MIRAALLAAVLATLPVSPNPISLSQVQTEFGGANPVSLSEYYEGGAYVTSSDTQPNNIPTSGTISLWQFYGAAKNAATPPSSVAISPTTGVTCSCSSGGASTCACTTGTMTCTPTGGSNYTYSWTWVSGSTYVVNSPAGSTTTFYRSATATWDPINAVCNELAGTYKCCVNGVCSALFYVSSEHCKI